MMDEDAGRATLKMHLVTCLKCLNSSFQAQQMNGKTKDSFIQVCRAFKLQVESVCWTLPLKGILDLSRSVQDTIDMHLMNIS